LEDCAIRFSIVAIAEFVHFLNHDCAKVDLAQSSIVIPAIPNFSDAAITNRMAHSLNHPIVNKSSIDNPQSSLGRAQKLMQLPHTLRQSGRTRLEKERGFHFIDVAVPYRGYRLPSGA